MILIILVGLAVLVLVRLFNTVGSRQTGRYGMVVPRFVERALRGDPLLVYGTGQQRRCFAYVGDVVEGLIDLMLSDNAPGRVYNIGSQEEISIAGLADKIIEMTGCRSETRSISYEEAYGRPFDDMMRRLPCLDRVTEAIGYQSKTSLTRILEEVIAEKRERIDAAP